MWSQWRLSNTGSLPQQHLEHLHGSSVDLDISVPPNQNKEMKQIEAFEMKLGKLGHERLKCFCQKIWRVVDGCISRRSENGYAALMGK